MSPISPLSKAYFSLAFTPLKWLTAVILITATTNRSTYADNLSFDCDYGPEFSEKMHAEQNTFMKNLNNVIEKSDVDKLSTIFKTLALKTDEDYLKEIVSSLPTKKTISDLNENTYNEEHTKSIQKAYQSLFNNIMDQISNSSSSLQYDLDKIKDEIFSLTQQNATGIMEKMNGLLTHESMKKLSDELPNIATKEDLQTTEKQIINLSQTLKHSISKDSLNLTNLLTQEGGNEFINSLSSIISQQDIVNVYISMNLLSTEDSINVLFEKIAGLPKKEKLESMGVFIGDTSPIKIDVKKIMDQMDRFASKEAVKTLENSINALEKEVDAYLDELNDIITIASLLLENLVAQDEMINNLELYFNEHSSPQSILDLKELLEATYSSTNATLEYVNRQEVSSSPNPLRDTNQDTDCVQSDEIEESISDLHRQIDSICNKHRLKDLLFSYESTFIEKIENISSTVTIQKDIHDPPTSQLTPKAKRVLETTPCEDSEFVGAPEDICSVVVARNLCSLDPLMSYHCCRSCVRAGQIQEMGPHRYIQVPRIIKYNAAIEMILDQN